MPKVSKIKTPTSTKPGAAKPVDDRNEFYCCRCGRKHTKQKGNYPASQSPLYRKNNGYLPICNNCIDEVYGHYKSVLGSDKAAIRRVCMKFDIYWNEDIYAMLNKTNTSTSRIKSYISRTNLYVYVGKTYDDTLDEEARIGGLALNDSAQDDTENSGVDIDIIEFWGAGFDPALYIWLDKRYQYWTKDLPKPLDQGAEATYRQICLLEATINRDTAAGRSTEKSVNTLNTLLGSANRKPIQRMEDATDAAFDSMPFGVGIKVFENTKPIPKPDDDFKDVDGIIRYISIWFLGHLCKMLGIKNGYCKLYEDEIAKLRIENPEIAEEDDESLFNDIFGGET